MAKVEWLKSPYRAEPCSDLPQQVDVLAGFVEEIDAVDEQIHLFPVDASNLRMHHLVVGSPPAGQPVVVPAQLAELACSRFAMERITGTGSVGSHLAKPRLLAATMGDG